MDQLENVLLALDKAHIVFEEGGAGLQMKVKSD